MPQETLTFPPLYCVVGAYRLLHDPTLWKPMWAKCSKAAKQASIAGVIWLVVTWPIQKLFVYYFMSASASVTGFTGLYGKIVETADVADDDLPFRIPVPSLQTFATLMFVLGQVHAIMEFWLRRKLRECRNTAYVQTVRSRGKAADWWTEYVEEFKNPPTQKAIKDAKKQGWYMKLASPLVRFVILKVFLLPVDFVPFFGMALGAALRSLTYGRLLHKHFFEAKRMSPFQIELWITERQTAYRSFGFVAALMERIPLIGLVFSVSNQIGAAMWAHDLEKRQQHFRSSTSSTGDRIELEEFKNKPTLKKIYKNVRDDVPQQDEQEGDNFRGEGLAVVRFAPEIDDATFTNLSFTFPLKLISPRTSGRNANLGLRNHAAVAQEGALNEARAAAAAKEVVPRKAKAVAVLYIVGYGGGLVSGDTVDLDIDVGTGCSMVLLTQGSTKVFKTRMTRPTKSVSTAHFSSSTSPDPLEDGQGGKKEGGASSTRQTYRYMVRPHSTLILLPDPVTCFAGARYDQVQRFDLRDGATSSIVVLDWITSGRTAVPAASSTTTSSASAAAGEGGGKLDHLDAHSSFAPSASGVGAKGMKYTYAPLPRQPEHWAFTSYRSRNEVRSSGTVVARDVLLLSQDPSETYIDPGSGLNFTELARRNHPYGCYATLLLSGPDAAGIIEKLSEEFESIQQRPTTTLPTKGATEGEEVLWSLSHITQPSAEGGAAGGGMVVVRMAAQDAQTVRKWLFKRLTPLEQVVGADLYRQALGS